MSAQTVCERPRHAPAKVQAARAHPSATTAAASDGNATAAVSSGTVLELHPPLEPYDTGMLDVDLEVGHKIYYAQSGNPAGVPVLSLHGGPGVGCSPATRSCFNPDTYRIVLFDQRGAGRSTPLGCLTNNTTAHLIEDIEKLRKHLGVRRWGMVTGGSWGCFLAVAYTQLHSNRVAGLLLRSVFMGADAEVKWLFEAGGASEFYPEAWERFERIIPEEERGCMVQAYYKRLTHPNEAIRLSAAVQFLCWEDTLSRIAEYNPRATLRGLRANTRLAEAFARIECHYMANRCFLGDSTSLLQHVHSMVDVPTFIVHGRLDLVCRPAAAAALHKALPLSDLRMVYNAGHSLGEPGILDAVLRVCNGWECMLKARGRTGARCVDAVGDTFNGHNTAPLPAEGRKATEHTHAGFCGHGEHTEPCRDDSLCDHVASGELRGS